MLETEGNRVVEVDAGLSVSDTSGVDGALP